MIIGGAIIYAATFSHKGVKNPFENLNKKQTADTDE